QEKMTAYELASHIGKTTKLIAELYNDKTVEGVSRFENAQELLNSIKEFVEEDEVHPQTPEGGLNTEEPLGPPSVSSRLREEDLGGGDRSLGTFLQNVSLLTGDDKETQNADAVKLMTVHSAKGLE